MNGFQVKAAIRSNEFLSQPFLIAFTAWDDPKTIEQSSRFGFDRHLAKTSRIDNLVAAVESSGR